VLDAGIGVEGGLGRQDDDQLGFDLALKEDGISDNI
jgi:hypothetical protein